MNMIYCGIGSRQTPTVICEAMERIAEQLSDKGYTLRSGHAQPTNDAPLNTDSADLAFERGAGKKEIYLPFRRYGGSDSHLYTVTEAAMKMAESLHPAWHQLNTFGRSVMARNCYQVLGIDLATPADFIVCWTPNGRMAGGTSQALRLASIQVPKIPIYNLAINVDIEALERDIGISTGIKTGKVWTQQPLF